MRFSQTNGVCEAPQSQRFEMKYAISELEAEAVRNFIEPHILPDCHAKEGARYEVHTLYLDSSDLALYSSSALGELNRFKLRVRSYEDHPEAPLFFEVKRRADRVILKQRARVKRSAANRVLAGEDVGQSVLVSPTHDEAVNLSRFRDYMEALGAKPRVMVRYEREAYESVVEAGVRITIDRRIACAAQRDYTPCAWSQDGRWRDLDGFAAILELKFWDTFPAWLAQLVRRFDLSRDSIAKYVVCIRELEREGVSVAG